MAMHSKRENDGTFSKQNLARPRIFDFKLARELATSFLRADLHERLNQQFSVLETIVFVPFGPNQRRWQKLVAVEAWREFQI